jgi:hypothetical protein
VKNALGLPQRQRFTSAASPGHNSHAAFENFFLSRAFRAAFPCFIASDIVAK